MIRLVSLKFRSLAKLTAFAAAIDVNSYAVFPLQLMMDCRLSEEEIDLAKTAYDAKVMTIVIS